MNYRLNRQLKQGRGEPLVFLHGLGLSGRYWKPVFKHLPIDLKVSSYDLLGFGESPKPEPYNYTAAQQSKALLRSLRWNYPFRKVTLVGHSMGGLVVLEFAKQYPSKVKKLIITNVPILLSSNDYRTVKKRYAEVGDRLRNNLHATTLRTLHSSDLIKERILPRYARYKLNQPEFDRYDLEHISPYAYEQSLKNVMERHDVLHRIKHLKMPVRIVQANRDRATIKGNTEKLAAKLNNCWIIRVFGTHQFPYTQPKDFVKILKKVL